MAVTKEEKQAFIKAKLIEVYTEGVRRDEDEDGPISSLGLYSFVSSFSEISGGSCYDIHAMLEKNGVLPGNTKHDHEHSCCFYYFPDWITAITFVNNLASFMLKRMQLSADYMLYDDFKLFRKWGCFDFPA